jgi:ADP-ribose pyrophosphatase YjhB (NUDIX family)
MPPPRFCSQCAAALDVTGRPAVCTGCGRAHHRDPKVGAGVVARDEAGGLLLVQRGVQPGRGLWSLPAGYVDADEDPRQAAAREALEETGLVVEVGRVVDVYPGGGGASFFLAFEAQVVGGELAAGDDALDARFFGPDALPELAFESTRDVVRRVLGGQVTRAGRRCCPGGATPRA